MHIEEYEMGMWRVNVLYINCVVHESRECDLTSFTFTSVSALVYAVTVAAAL